MITIRDLTKSFKERPNVWRIEAVIHDGSWYDIPKWAKFAKVPKKEVIEWLGKNKDKQHIIKAKHADSYRVSYDEVIRWYGLQKDINIKDKIIPRNYPPRLWNNHTEVETFIATPRRRTATVSFNKVNDEILDKVKNALAGVARVRYDKKDRYRAYGLSHDYIHHQLMKALTPEEMEKLEIKQRSALYHRELADFEPEFFKPALLFYLGFARNVLKSKLSTLRIYLPEEGDIDSQIIIWIITAMKKFDETQPVPFSGYLSKVLNFWPYDLPDEKLGKELSSFQRQRQRAINEITKNNQSNASISNRVLAQAMNMPLPKFMDLNNQHKAWLGEHNSTTLTWEDSSNEKQGRPISYEEPGLVDNDNYKLAFSISKGVVLSALDTDDYEDALKIINNMAHGSANFNEGELKHIDKVFKKSLYSQIIRCEHEQE